MAKKNIEKSQITQSLREELKTLKDVWHSPIDLGHGVVTRGWRAQRPRETFF